MQLNLGNPTTIFGLTACFASAALFSAGKKLVNHSNAQQDVTCSSRVTKTAGYTLMTSGILLGAASALVTGIGMVELTRWYANNRHLISIGELFTEGGGALSTLGAVSFILGMGIIK